MPQVVFYRDRRGRDVVGDYIRSLTRRSEVTAIIRSIDLLAEYGRDIGRLGADVVRRIDPEQGIYELRPGPHRIAYAQAGNRFVLLHVWRKQGQKLDPRALQQARAHWLDWRERESHP